MLFLNALFQADPATRASAVIDPAAALIVFAILTVLIAALFWPTRGIIPRARRLTRLDERVRIEDALKHLTNTELSGLRATIESVGGALEISRGRTVELLSLLTSRGLVHLDGDALALSADGRAYGMRILRAHRLLERYFADRTGMAPGEWHDRAEREEHALSEVEAERLALSMGDPLVDPHGDPIPSRTGVVPPRSGFALVALPAGAAGTVVHVEDEPREIYDRLRALGIHPGVPVKVLETRPDGVHLLVAGSEVKLDSALEANVTVEPVAERQTHTVLMERLDTLRPGELAWVEGIAPAVQGPERRRLLDLGIVPGTEIVAEMRSAGGDPIAYRIRGALIALRKSQAAGIYVRRAPDTAPVEQVA